MQDVIKKISDIEQIVYNGFLADYIEYKKGNFSTILVYQIGDFFEIFLDDAQILHEILGLKLSYRVIKGLGKLQQIGFGINQFDVYIHKIIQNDFKVAVFREFKTDSLVYRKLDRKYTRGTIFESELLDSFENNYLASLIKTDTNSDLVQLSYADVSTGQSFTTLSKVSIIYQEINKIQPKEILILSSQRDYFSQFLDNKYNIEFVDFNVNNSFELMLEYYKQTCMSYLPKMSAPIDYEISSFMYLDQISRQNLEITKTKYFHKKKGSLFWFLNQTITSMGARHLKYIIDTPLLDIDEIKKRQKIVSTLVDNPNKLNYIRKIFEILSDTFRACAKLSNKTIMPKDLILICLSLSNFNELTKILKELKLNKYFDMASCFDKIIDFCNILSNVLQENLPNDISHGNIFKSSYDSHLDYLRFKLNKCLDEFCEIELQIKKDLNFNDLKIELSSNLGCYIEISKKNTVKLPNYFILKQSLVNVRRYTTPELNKLFDVYNSLKYQISNYEKELYFKLLDRMSGFSKSIRCASNVIASLDVFCSFAYVANKYNFSCPKFNNEGLFITDGYHPSLIKLGNEIVKNDLTLKNDSMIVLSGSNMSGKSTFLKQTALISILAQIGAFVPSKSANLTIVDKVFIRQTANDDIINNNSSFMVEMNDFKYILDNVSNNSLILFDEPAKSTSEKEGGAIAFAYFEYLLKNYKAKIITVTHNLFITNLEELFPDKVTNYMIGEFFTSDFMDRKIKKGVINKSYAINTAILANLPNEIIEKSKYYLKD